MSLAIPAFLPDRRLSRAEPVCRAARQREQLDEPGARRLAELAARLAEARQVTVVQSEGRPPGYGGGQALIELHRHLPGNPLVGRLHVRVEVLPQRLPPQARIAEVRPAALEHRLELVL